MSADKNERWAAREEPLQCIRDAGFRPLLINFAARHYRIKMPDYGWVDYWPSTDRWCESQRPAGAPQQKGFGVTSLIGHLRAIRESQR